MNIFCPKQSKPEWLLKTAVLQHFKEMSTIDKIDQYSWL